MRVAIVSGNANNGANAGTFYWNLNNASSNVNRNIGARQVVKIYPPNFLPLLLKEYDVHKSLVEQSKNLD